MVSFLSEFSTHFTRIIEDADQTIICNVRPLDQNLTAITDLGTDEMRVLYSPGFITGEQWVTPAVIISYSLMRTKCEIRSSHAEVLCWECTTLLCLHSCGTSALRNVPIIATMTVYTDSLGTRRNWGWSTLYSVEQMSWRSITSLTLTHRMKLTVQIPMEMTGMAS